METDDEVELGKIFGPADLVSGKEFGCCEVLQVLVVSNHVDWSFRSFKVVSPDLECLEDRKEFLIVDVVVEFRSGESPGVKSDQMNFPIVRRDEGEDGCKGIVGSVCFHHELGVQDPMYEDWSSGESLLECVEGRLAILGKVPFDVLPSQSHERNCDIRVVMDQSSMEVGKPKERLDVFHFVGYRPLMDGFDLVGGHGKAIWGEDISEILHGVTVPFAFTGACKQVVLPESPENLSNVFSMLFGGVGVHKDVVEVDKYIDVKEVAKNIVHESLGGCRSVC
jgi:hypothetical protein